MKKLLLVSLTTMLCTVMAWGTVHTAGTFDELQSAITSAAAGDVIELTADIAYTTNGTGLINITKSITLDGKGHKLSGYGTANISVSATQNWPVTLAVNYGGSASAALDVTIQNLHVSNNASGNRSYGLMAWDGVDKLTLKNDSIYLGKSTASYKQVICFTGTDATPINLKIEDSFIGTATGSGYPAYILKPIKGTFKNTKFSGYCALYFKYRATGAYGTVVGSRGSVINADNCNFDAPNIHSGYSNDFAVFAFEDDGITLNLNNCGMNAEVLGNADQTMVSASEYATRREQNININISGDNSYINGDFVSNGWNFKYGTAGGNSDSEIYENGYWQKWNSTKKEYDKTGYNPALAFTPYTGRVNVTITGGTYAINPYTYRFVGHVISAEDLSEFEQRKCTIPDGYEVKEITTTQEGETTTLYRVREVITGSTALNDNAGQNPTEDIKVTSDVELTYDNTKAEFIEVKGSSDPASETVTVTVPEDKTLTISNGLDVTGNAEVVVKSGSTVAVSKGGVIAEKASNIVIEADENGAASFLLSPEVIVNTTPVITVKMTTNVGTIDAEDDDYAWHRFAAPVAHIKSFSKDVADAGTWIFGWNYGTNSWQQLSKISDMTPFHGYTLTHTKSYPTPVVYTFTGELAGNTDNTLQFSSRGYNYFGNSYSGYIDIRQLLNKLDLDAIDASVWMWDQENDSFKGVPIRTLQDNPSEFDDDPWKKEVAPMQTFILRWMNGSESPDGEISYADAIWGNPRYSSITGIVSAPRRAKAEQDNASVRVKITSANGKKDYIDFREADRFNDTYESGYDVSKFMNENTLNIYSTVNGEDCETVATDNLVGKTISLQTLNEINYTLSFARVSGATYAIKDMQTGVVTLMSDENTYEFTAQPNATTEGRFMIVEVNKVPTTIDNVSITPAAKGIYTLLGQYIGESDMWNTLPSGVYVVDGVKLVK